MSLLFRTVSRTALLVALVVATSRTEAAEATASPPPAAKAVSISIDAGLGEGAACTLRGSDARQQLIVTAKLATGELRDVTRDVTFAATPAQIVSIDSTGLVRPLADGKATIRVSGPEGLAAEIGATVTNFVDDPDINFPNSIVPVFTKYGCNSGGCHGKASGQNGFKLSLLGFEPGEDYEHLVKEGRGRRLFPSAADESLLLQKSINAVPHGGGQRIEFDSHEYRLMRRWIVQGMPFGKSTDPTVERISVTPTERSMARNGQQQIVVLAHYSDGSTEDVTRLAQYEPNSTEMAEATATGLVKTMDLAGDVAIMARYQGQVGVFRASLPLGAKVENLPPVRNFIDELVFKKLKTLGVPPSAISDDATFIRRVTVDIAGRLPTMAETRQYLADTDAAKRDKLVERLVDTGEYADYFANKWSAILRNRRQRPTYLRGTYGFHDWIRESLYQNVPYDQFVRGVLTASGDMGENPAVAWYREVKDVDQQVEDCAQLFLGLRIQCARCHHHPFEKWSQRDYYGFSAFFTQVGRKNGEATDEQRIFHKRGVAAATNPKTGERLKPTGLGAAALDVPAEIDPRHALADWMSDPNNPFFAKSLVNRYWKHFFSRGIVDPEDDMRVTNPASNPELLDALAKHFIQSKYDLKDLVRTICKSQVYQLSAEPNEFNRNDKQNFSRYYPKRLPAEVLLDGLDTATGTPTGFAGLPAGTRAVQLPDAGVGSYFLTVFGRPESASACECERSGEANLAQSLHLLNSSEVQGKLTNGNGRAALFAKDAKRSPEENIRDLYVTVYSREPAADELKIALGHLTKATVKQQAYEDVLWALVNTKEFLFNH